MRKIFKSAFAGLAILCSTSLTSCSNEIPSMENENIKESDVVETTENDKDNLVTISSITVPLYINDSSTTNSRTSYEDDEANGVIKVKWVLNDTIYVGVPAKVGDGGGTVKITDTSSGFKAYKVSAIDETGKTATFTPSEEGGAYTAEEGTNVLAYYGTGDDMQVNTKYGQLTYKNPTKQSVHTSQNLKFLYEYDFMSASTTVTADGTLDFKFQHEVGFLKLRMTNLDTDNISWKTIQLSLSGENNIFKKYKYKVNTGEVSYEDDVTTINLNINYYNKKSEIEIFVALMPTTFSQETDSKMEIILTDENGTNEMRYALRPGTAIEKGKCYTINAPMVATTTISGNTTQR